MKKKIIEIKNNLELFSQKGKWQNTIVRIILSDLFWILLVCAFIRLIYYSCLLNSDNFTDTFTYTNYTGDIFKGNIDAHRTPVYPYLIKLIRLLGNQNLIQNIVYVQSFISFISIIYFYKTTQLFLKNRKIIIFTTLFFGISPAILSLDKCILPESLSVSALIFYIYLIFSFINKPSIQKATITSFYVFFLIMLRPGFLYILPLMIMFWIVRLIKNKKEVKMSFSGLVTTFICIMMLFGYANLNYKKNGVKTISVVSSVNTLYEIIKFGIYENNPDKEITEFIKSTMAGTENEASDIMGSYNGSSKFRIYEEEKYKIIDSKLWSLAAHKLIYKFSYKRISIYINNCLRDNYKTFIKQKVMHFVLLSQSQATPFFPETKLSLMSTCLILFKKVFDISFIFVYFLMGLDGLYILVHWNKTRQIPWFKIIIWTLISLQLISIIIGAPNCFDRLFLPVLPLVVMIMFSYFDLIYSSRIKNVNKY